MLCSMPAAFATAAVPRFVAASGSPPPSSHLALESILGGSASVLPAENNPDLCRSNDEHPESNAAFTRYIYHLQAVGDD